MPKPGTNWADEEEDAAGETVEAAPAAPPGFGGSSTDGSTEDLTKTESEVTQSAEQTETDADTERVTATSADVDAVSDQLSKTVEVDDEGDAPSLFDQGRVCVCGPGA